jgi:hypothetical protein
MVVSQVRLLANRVAGQEMIKIPLSDVVTVSTDVGATYAFVTGSGTIYMAITTM